ncbi:hypothetical protein BCR39DRAFT_506164 [Naematelia encephala]|uniref:C2 domain-containing protein n=1 Tax=Naematelia encephala TaxID=71784 RepID=A0A1Y2AZ05_9TREE|nr:hypothetical protein BCR39DRAFT_506164 [Naematelia encephala]
MPDKQPAGGYDSTSLNPSTEPTYTVRIKFHRATNVPISDFGSASSDPFIIAQLNTGRPTRHDYDPPLRFRSNTSHRTREPEFNASWVVAGITKSGFTLKVHLYDEDPGDHDDRLGKLEIETGPIREGWRLEEKEYKVHKTGANFRAYAFRSCMTIVHPKQELHARLAISIEVLGKTKEEVGKAYTVNNFWWVHYSPLIGRLAGTKAKVNGVEQYDFQANEMQLQGPVPNELYHRYVEFKTFVAGMFTGKGLRGKVLHNALHHQHERIYNFDRKTLYGELEGPGEAMTLQFLDMVHYDQGGRIFTYVITLDGMFRFTETGKEFGIDLLSKHTMHSDVNIYIAWSGEFLVRRLAHPSESADDPNQHTHPAEHVAGGPPDEGPPKDPRYYELIIDNDSGTYRPNADLIPVFKKFLNKNFPGLQVVVKSCTDDELTKIKDDQKKIKKEEGDHRVYGQGSQSSSISTSDAESLDQRAQDMDNEHTGKLEKVADALENPKDTVKGIIPGEKGKEERERAEDNDVE